MSSQYTINKTLTLLAYLVFTLLVINKNQVECKPSQTIRIRCPVGSKECRVRIRKVEQTLSPRIFDGGQAKVSEVCGYSTKQLINGGQDVSPGEFPWLGAMFYLGENPKKFICTVNLVTTKHVLTAAHCTSKSTNTNWYYLILGHLMPEPHRRTSIIAMANHPDYDKTKSEHDIAILTLGNSVQFSTESWPICITFPPAMRDNNNDGMVAGFGPDYTTYRKVDAPRVSNQECRDNALPQFRFYVQTNNVFCAGRRDNSGPCKGDSGAGYMQGIDGRLYMRGVVSRSLYTNGTCDFKQYVIYADLINDMEWVKTELAEFLT